MEIEKQLAFMEYIDQPYFKISSKEGDIFYRGQFIKIAREFIEYRNDNWESLPTGFNFETMVSQEIITVEAYLQHYCSLHKYLILTDEEADKLWNNKIKTYFDFIVLSEIPNCLKRFINYELWEKEQSLIGRGPLLATFDGHEHEVYVKEFDKRFYIYKIE